MKNIDIESYDSTTVDALKQYQKLVLNSIYGTMGVKMNIVTPPQFIVYDEAIVDGNTWYHARVSGPVYAWLLEQDRSMWADCDNIGNRTGAIVDMHEQLYTLMTLRWV